MRISTQFSLVAIVGACLLMGQSCSIPGMGTTSQQKSDGGVFRSDDHGQTWRQKSSGSTSNSRGIRYASIRTLVFDPRNPDRLTVGTADQGLWISNNAGDVWTSTNLTSGNIPCIAMKDSDPDVQYVSSGASVLKSIDNGQTWRTVYSDGQGQAVTCVATDRALPGTVWATTLGGRLMRSDDDGQSWTIALTIKTFYPRQIVQDDQLPGHLIIFTKTTGIIDVDYANHSWQDLSGALRKYPGAVNVNGVAVTFGSPTVWTIATPYGLLQSFDRGLSWTVVPTLVTPGTSPIQNVAVNPRDQKEMFITVGSKLHHTRDAGQTWTMVTLPTSRLPVNLHFDPVRIDRVYVGSFFVAK